MVAKAKTLRSGIFLIFIALIQTIILSQGSSAMAFSQGGIGEITHSIRVNGGLATGINCNITIFYPNNTVLIDFQGMTDRTDHFNYTLNGNQTSLKGMYNYDVTCFSSSENKTERFEYIVNAGGVDPSSERTDAITRTLYIVFVIGIIFFITYFFSKHPTLKWTWFLLGMMMFLIVMNFVFISLQDEVVNPKIEGFFSFFITSFYIIFWFLFVILAILWIVTIIATFLWHNHKKEMTRYGKEF